jgi:hypothetical protein
MKRSICIDPEVYVMATPFTGEGRLHPMDKEIWIKSLGASQFQLHNEVVVRFVVGHYFS